MRHEQIYFSSGAQRLHSSRAPLRIAKWRLEVHSMELDKIISFVALYYLRTDFTSDTAFAGAIIHHTVETKGDYDNNNTDRERSKAQREHTHKQSSVVIACRHQITRGSGDFAIGHMWDQAPEVETGIGYQQYGSQ
jgi:hypothetical protein